MSEMAGNVDGSTGYLDTWLLRSENNIDHVDYAIPLGLTERQVSTSFRWSMGHVFESERGRKSTSPVGDRLMDGSYVKRSLQA